VATRLAGHSGEVECVVVLHENRRACSGGEDGIRVWNIGGGGRCERVLRGHAGAVCALAALPGGRVVSGGVDATLKVWVAATGVLERTLLGHTSTIRTIAVLSPTTFASAGDCKTICVFDLGGSVTGKAPTDRLDGHTARIWALVALPDGRLASGSHDTTIRIWSMGRGAQSGRGGTQGGAQSSCVAVLTGHARGVTALALTGGGGAEPHLLSAATDGSLRLWSISGGDDDASRCIRILDGHARPVVALAARPDGRVVSISTDGELRMWNADGSHADDVQLPKLAPGICALAALDD
jgi:WD40 repeat protein